MTGQEAIVFICFIGGAGMVLRPIAGAIARRIGGEAQRAPSPDQFAALRVELAEELEHVRLQLGELAERLDFTERLLAKGREGERIGPGR